MSCPVSSCPVKILDEQCREGAVFGGVGGNSASPAVPRDAQPRSGEDADGVGVVGSSGSGAVVEVGGPGAGSSAVGGESVTTTGLSGNSIATSGASHSSKTRRSRSPVASCSNVLRAISRPLTSTTRRSSHALLIRPVTRLAGSPAGYFGQSSHGLPGASASEEARSYGAGAPLAIRSVFGVRSALSSVAVPQADAECRSAHAGHDRCRASPAITRRRLGCVGDPFTITDLTIVRQ